MNQEAIRKMRLAHKYQREAILACVPEEIREHLVTIENEVGEIIKVFMGKQDEKKVSNQKESSGKVKKVQID